MTARCDTAANRRLGAQVGARADLMAYLDRIDDEGWDGPAGRVVLDYARHMVVVPVVRALKIHWSIAAAAESTGWATAWEALQGPAVRNSHSPWGVVSIAVRRAVAGEWLAERYGTDVWSAWRIERFRGDSSLPDHERRTDNWAYVKELAALASPARWTAMIDGGYDAPEPAIEPSFGPRMQVLADLLVEYGWEPDMARGAVAHVVEHAAENRPDAAEAPGWRGLAVGLGIPPWRARRVTVLLLGAPGWPGLAERLVTGGPAALTGPAIAAAVRATCDESMRQPARAAMTIAAREARRATLAS